MIFQNINELAELPEMIRDGYITAREHPTHPLTIYNYTAKAQYEKVWNEATMSCRGLIADDRGNIVARPFQKFFNLEEAQTLPDEPFEVWEKLDGSLMVSYWIEKHPYLASRGSFESPQAKCGSHLLYDLYSPHLLDSQYTYLFELIAKNNRIVVDYGNRAALVLLAIINTKTGEEIGRLPDLGFLTARQNGTFFSIGEFKNWLMSAQTSQDDARKYHINQAGMEDVSRMSPDRTEEICRESFAGKKSGNQGEHKEMGNEQQGPCSQMASRQIPRIQENSGRMEEQAVHGLWQSFSSLRYGLRSPGHGREIIRGEPLRRKSRLQENQERDGKVRCGLCELSSSSDMEEAMGEVTQRGNIKEGFVIKFQSGLRVKVKLAEYLRLHKLLTGISEKTILEDWLMEGRDLTPLLDRVPDEFAGWVKDVIKKMHEQYKTIYHLARDVFQKSPKGTRKEFAAVATTTKFASVLFNMLDGRECSKNIWKMIQADTKKFRYDEE